MMQEQELRVLKKQALVMFSRLQLQRAEISVEETLDGHLRFMVSWKVAAQQAQDTVRAPADWWQAVKERWFPEWALRRWPVRYQEWRAHRILPAVRLPDAMLEGSFFEMLRP